MDYDQEDLITAMYQDDEQEATAAPVVVNPSGFRRTREIRVGAVRYELPSVEYVASLEQTIKAQAKLIDTQRTELQRLNNFMLSTRNFIRRQTAHIGEMQNSLDHKIDSREAL